MTPQDLLARIVDGDTLPFALLQRSSALGATHIEILTGDTGNVAALADIPLSNRSIRTGKVQHDVFVLVPHRQVTERGFEAVQDGTPLVVLSVRDQGQIPKSEVFDFLPDDEITLTNETFDISNEDYAQIVQEVLENEIGTGEGSNFVIKRSFVAEITDFSLHTALSLFRRLLLKETGAYWTFIVHTGDCTLVGATPERHISLNDGRAVMNPISGTFRYPEL